MLIKKCMLYFFCFMMFHEMKGDDFIHVYR